MATANGISGEASALYGNEAEGSDGIRNPPYKVGSSKHQYPQGRHIRTNQQFSRQVTEKEVYAPRIKKLTTTTANGFASLKEDDLDGHNNN